MITHPKFSLLSYNVPSLSWRCIMAPRQRQRRRKGKAFVTPPPTVKARRSRRAFPELRNVSSATHLKEIAFFFNFKMFFFVCGSLSTPTSTIKEAIQDQNFSTSDAKTTKRPVGITEEEKKGSDEDVYVVVHPSFRGSGGKKKDLLHIRYIFLPIH